MIDGGSAGGFAALAALTFHKVFSTGTSFCGISDLEAIARETHKFQSHYCDTLIGPYPEDKKKFKERSPINHIDQLDCPLAIFQGSEDKVSFFCEYSVTKELKTINAREFSTVILPRSCFN